MANVWKCVNLSGLVFYINHLRQAVNETVFPSPPPLFHCSDGSYPKDEGSSQEVSQSLFVGESRNRGTNGGQNKYWGIGGVDGKMRTLPRNKYVREEIKGF